MSIPHGKPLGFMKVNYNKSKAKIKHHHCQMREVTWMINITAISLIHTHPLARFSKSQITDLVEQTLEFSHFGFHIILPYTISCLSVSLIVPSIFFLELIYTISFLSISPKFSLTIASFFILEILH
jgi:hypothetical protein